MQLIIKDKTRDIDMKCPSCGGKTKVSYSRPVGNMVQRWRHCLTCDTRFVTYEQFTYVYKEPTDNRFKKHFSN